jgi:hypothetical protein
VDAGFENFELGTRFDAVVLPAGSFQLIYETAAAAGFLQRCRSHLGRAPRAASLPSHLAENYTALLAGNAAAVDSPFDPTRMSEGSRRTHTRIRASAAQGADLRPYRLRHEPDAHAARRQALSILCQPVGSEVRSRCLPVGRVSAAEIEFAVVDQLRCLLRAPEVIVGTWRSARPEIDGLTESEVRDALEGLDPLWDELFPAEQARIVQLLVERVDVGRDGVDIRLRVDGLA